MSTVDRQVAALAEALCDNSSDAADLAAMLQMTVDEFFGSKQPSGLSSSDLQGCLSLIESALDADLCDPFTGGPQP